MTLLWRYKEWVAVISLIVAAVGAWEFRYREGYGDGYQAANLKAQEFTERAIRELGNDADQAAADFLACRDSGRVWDFTRNECTKG